MIVSLNLTWDEVFFQFLVFWQKPRVTIGIIGCKSRQFLARVAKALEVLFFPVTFRQKFPYIIIFPLLW